MKASILKTITITLAVCIALSLIAEPENKSKAARLKEVIYKRTGGQVIKPGSQNGVAAVVNLQKKFDIKDIAPGIEYISQNTKFHFIIKDESDINVQAGNAIRTKKNMGLNVAVFVVNQGSDSNVIIMNQDAGWAIVNVANINTSNNQQVEKIILRALIGVCGGLGTQYDGTLVSPISKYEDLAPLRITDIPLDALSRFNKALPTKGMTPAYIRSYKAACQEGWASAPTNAVQKAIWDEVHAMPTAPIKIKPETKKVRE
jgi:hypothetical protein